MKIAKKILFIFVLALCLPSIAMERQAAEDNQNVQEEQARIAAIIRELQGRFVDARDDDDKEVITRLYLRRVQTGPERERLRIRVVNNILERIFPNNPAAIDRIVEALFQQGARGAPEGAAQPNNNNAEAGRQQAPPQAVQFIVHNHIHHPAPQPVAAPAPQPIAAPNGQGVGINATLTHAQADEWLAQQRIKAEADRTRAEAEGVRASNEGKDVIRKGLVGDQGGVAIAVAAAKVGLTGYVEVKKVNLEERKFNAQEEERQQAQARNNARTANTNVNNNNNSQGQQKQATSDRSKLATTNNTEINKPCMDKDNKPKKNT